MNENSSNRGSLESTGFYVFLVTVFLAPIAFLPTPYLFLDFIKTIIIVFGVLISALCYGVVIFREKSVVLPNKGVFITSLFILASLIISAFSSSHVAKSLFGQGFEIQTVGFLVALFVGAWIAYESVRRDHDRVFKIYGVLAATFLLLFLFHILRLAFGPSFMSFSILPYITSTVLGKWYDLSILSLFVLIISSSALVLLPLSRKVKIVYGIISFCALISAFIIHQKAAWFGAIIAFAVMSLLSWNIKRGFTRWFPVFLLIVAIVLFWKGPALANPFIKATNTQYSELSLPWQMTTDIGAGVIKNNPWFGIGPNHFSEAFMAYKPTGFNFTDAWSVEFNVGFGWLPTLFIDGGMVGTILWIILLMFFGIALANLSKRLPNDPRVRFVSVSSGVSVVFLWIMNLLYVPSHAIIFIVFVMTGLFVVSLVASDVVKPIVISPNSRKFLKMLFSTINVALIIVFVIIGFTYAKKVMALSYFGSGVKIINLGQDYKTSDAYFRKAISIDGSDLYFQALSENDRIQANRLISSATSSSPQLVSAVTDYVNDGIKAARQAIEYDPTNYYNYLSEARVSSIAAGLKIDKAYENTVRAYTDAIRSNPMNPSLYLNLAQIQAQNNKFDEALQTIGAALQVKNNYLDAIFLLSQIQVAQGNLKDAVTSVQVATKINPNNSFLFFELGLLNYDAKDYSAAAQALEQAIKLQPDYANAKYFLGLSYVRLNRNADAILQFQDLAKANPDNQEISFILKNITVGKSPFTDAKPPITPNPETRPKLPLKEKK